MKLIISTGENFEIMAAGQVKVDLGATFEVRNWMQMAEAGLKGMLQYIYTPS